MEEESSRSIKILKTREEYFAQTAFNYSTLKSIHPDPMRTMPSGDKILGDGLNFGTAVDLILFDGPEEFNKVFINLEYKDLTGQLKELATKYITIKTDKDYELAYQLSDELKLWASTKNPDLRKEKITEEFWDYIKAMDMKGTKIPLTNEMFERIGIAVNTLSTSTFTKDFYIEKPHTEVIYQLAFTFWYLDVQCRAMLDSVMIDHYKKKIYPTDTKTTENAAVDFNKAVLDFRYDVQTELYFEGLRQWKNEFYPEYELMPFRFIVISSKKPDRPLVFVLNPNQWRKRTRHKTHKLLSLKELIIRFKFARDNQLFEPMEMYTQGYIEL